MSEFLNLTRKDYAQQSVTNVGKQQQQQQGTNGVNGNNANSLKTTDVFTAAKNGMTAQNKAPQALDGGNSGFSGVNAFGEEGGYGDTVSFSTKTDKTAEGDTSSTGGFTGKLSAGAKFANNDSEIQELAEALGCEADEDTIKNKLSSMNPEELVKLEDDTLDTASDLGLISMGEIEKKLGADNQNNNNEQDNADEKKLKFGTFTSGSEV